MKKQVIWTTDIQSPMPISPSLFCWIILDKVNAAGWVRGCCWTIIGALWMGWVYSLINQERVHIFEYIQKAEIKRTIFG